MTRLMPPFPLLKIGENDNPGDQPVKAALDRYSHMRALDAWWKRAKLRLDWQPIATYPRLDGDMPLAEPMVLRSPYRWAYGCWHDGGWVKVTDGGSYRLKDLAPVQWAVPTLDDAIMLGPE